jgi:hypothetical protein
MRDAKHIEYFAEDLVISCRFSADSKCLVRANILSFRLGTLLVGCSESVVTKEEEFRKKNSAFKFNWV